MHLGQPARSNSPAALSESRDVKALLEQVSNLIDKLDELRATGNREWLPSKSRVRLAERLYRGRRSVDDLFNFDGFSASPAWDMMLDIFYNEKLQKHVSVTDACVAARCPVTTGLRWIKVLEERDLLVRTIDPDDKRRFFLELTHKGRVLTEKSIAAHVE
jgi:predicted transcriptional regulator